MVEISPRPLTSTRHYKSNSLCKRSRALNISLHSNLSQKSDLEIEFDLARMQLEMKKPQENILPLEMENNDLICDVSVPGDVIKAKEKQLGFKQKKNSKLSRSICQVKKC